MHQITKSIRKNYFLCFVSPAFIAPCQSADNLREYQIKTFIIPFFPHICMYIRRLVSKFSLRKARTCDSVNVKLALGIHGFLQAGHKMGIFGNSFITAASLLFSLAWKRRNPSLDLLTLEGGESPPQKNWVSCAAIKGTGKYFSVIQT